MKRITKLLVCLLLVALICVPSVQAGLINYERLEKLKNRGASPQQELPSWAKELPRVKYRVERRYDINRDGILQTAETKIYLRDVIRDVEQKGGYRVDSKILQEYDTNKDGVIDSSELVQLRKDASI